MNQFATSWRHSILVLALVLHSACGANPPPAPPSKSYSVGELDFIAAAKRHKIPARLLLAIAYVESRVNPETSVVTYENKELGPKNAESAFGISLTDLGLIRGVAPHSLEIQTEAYAKWLTTESPAGLTARFETDEDKFNWIWNVAQAHRQDDATRSLFARELITSLNEGFHWLDPKNRNIVEVAPEKPAIRFDSLRPVSQNQLKILSLTRSSPVRSARQLILAGQHEHEKLQTPRGITVIHCPFSFSACIEMQKNSSQDRRDFPLGAHFVIPNSPDLSEFPLQIAKLDHVVPTINSLGKTELSKDKVIVMLTGSSGRIVQSTRSPADPSWLTTWQLQRLGELVHDICSQLSIEFESSSKPFDMSACKQIDSEGTSFRSNTQGKNYKWGEIPDFDPSIFTSYINHPEHLAGKTVFEYPQKRQVFKKGETISLKLGFGLKVRSIQLEQLVRCKEDGALTWSPISQDQVRSSYDFVFNKKLYDSGPNEDGTHFFRAKTFGKDGSLLGWDLATLYISNYEDEKQGAGVQTCHL